MFSTLLGRARSTGRLLAVVLGLALPTVAAAQTVTPEWQKVIDAAKKEGSVTIYSGHGLAQLNDLAARFKRQYGINVLVVRGVDADINPKVDIELETGRGIADIYVTTDKARLAMMGQKGYMVPVVGPSFNNPAYKRAENAPNGTYFATSGSVITFGWNTDLLPNGLNDYNDAIKPDLKGLIGIPNAQSPFLVDYWLYLMENFGKDFPERLAGLKPRTYPGALPLQQAVTSGEIAVALYGQPLIDEKESGAPVDWKLNSNPFGATFYGVVLKTTPKPNAAQLLADFMVTESGQEALGRKASSVLPNIKGAVGETGKMRQLNLERVTPETISAFQARWNKLFGAN
jgi:iron(III) transport system substrate-binding protein